MKIGIMQPYFVPYIGYWQLMNAVDKYVIYDDVNFIKGGWINRNRILVNGETKFFNIPMLGASSNKLINEVQVNNKKELIDKNMRIIEAAYKKAPYYPVVSALIKEILYCNRDNLASYIANSFNIITDYLGIKTELLLSSELDKDCNLKGQNKVIEICKLLQATDYYNAIGGETLYSYSAFEDVGIRLQFLKTDKIKYKQFSDSFVDNLSIIDVMMFNSQDDIKGMLLDYRLIIE